MKRLSAIVTIFSLGVLFFAPTAFAKVGDECANHQMCGNVNEICTDIKITPYDTVCTTDQICANRHGALTKCKIDLVGSGKKCQSFKGSCSKKATLAATSTLPAVSGPKFEATAPTLQIDIPKFDGFSQVKTIEEDDGTTYAIFPWISQYIQAIYLYLLGIVGLVVVLVFIHAGLEWMASGGNAEGINKAKSKMVNATIGMVAVFGSYTILALINPNLVRFEGLKVQILDNVPLVFIEKPAESDQDPNVKGKGKPISDTTYDTVFQSYAGCARTDWRVLKSIAFKESRLNAEVKNSSGFIGLFQTKAKFCKSALDRYGAAGMCGDLKNPNNNTAVGAAMTRVSVDRIDKACPDASIKDFYTLVYIGHNAGPGSLKHVLKKGGCTAQTIESAFVPFWTKILDKRKPEKHEANQKNGIARFKYAQKVANTVMAQGVNTKKVNGACPMTN